ncbi:MAG: response regulator [Betaproteobacteria bacterium]|nr:response regulator [Betaproteobacteria bacterium]
MRALRKKVLVVDDDPVVGRSIDRVLSEKGYAVSTAADGQEALNKLAEEHFDVVYTDIKMPGMDGIEVAERVKQRRPWIPVVIITGYGTAANKARAEAAGVPGFLRKPLSPELIEGSAREAPAVAAEKAGAAKRIARSVANIVLLFAAPFIGLVYALAFPFIGLGMLAWAGTRALAKRLENVAFVRKPAVFLKNVILFFAAPFIGLAYALAFPFIGLGMLVWWGARALVKRSAPE